MQYRSYLQGFVGALVAIIFSFIAYTAYQDHKVLWEIVRVLNTPKGGQQNEPATK